MLIFHIFSLFQKLADLEARLVRLDSGDVDVVRFTIEEFSEKVNLDKDSILNKLTQLFILVHAWDVV